MDDEARRMQEIKGRLVSLVEEERRLKLKPDGPMFPMVAMALHSDDARLLLKAMAFHVDRLGDVKAGINAAVESAAEHFRCGLFDSARMAMGARLMNESPHNLGRFDELSYSQGVRIGLMLAQKKEPAPDGR